MKEKKRWKIKSRQMLVAVASELRMVIVMSALRNRRDKEMTNREKYAKEILDIACSGDKLAMRKADKRLIGCNKLECNGCCFSGTGRCSEVIQKWAEFEYIESPVISKADRAFLEYFIEKYKYIARDENGNLIVYETQPRKGESYWIWICDSHLCLERHFNVDFPMIKWSDSEPWLIEDLKKLEVVENYE